MRGRAASTRSVDRRVLQQQRIAFARSRDQIVFALALRLDEIDAAGAENLALECDVGKVVVGDQRAHCSLSVR